MGMKTFGFKDKKGQFQVVAWLFALLIGSPWVLLGLGIFLVLVLLGFYFALDKLIGAGLVAFGGFLAYRMSWRIGFPVMAVGIFLFWNPFGWETLSVVGLNS